ncbi:hypothetical protein LLG95_12510 [bacterium]|nr:hypothetical protein [bacterium]
MEKDFEGILADVASRLANAADGRFDDILTGALRELVTALGYDRSSIAAFQEHGARLRITHTWAVEGVPNVPMDFIVETEAPWMTHQLRSGHIVSLTRASVLPAAAEKEKGYLLSTGLSTVTMIPLVIEEAIVGALGFGSFRPDKVFPPEIVTRLRLIAEVLSLGLRRHQYARGLKRLSQTMNEMSVNAGVRAPVRNEQFRELALRLIDIEQQERLRMGDILHEDVMQSLAAAAMIINPALTHQSESPTVSQAVAALGDALGKLKKLAMILRPDALARQKITDCIQWLAYRTQRAGGIETDVFIDEAIEPLKPEIRTFLYETTRKLLENAVTHSKASKIEIELRRVKNLVQLVVTDDGIGFDPSLLGIMPATNQGLFSIRELTNLLGGEMEIVSGHGKKTRVMINVPA